MLKGPEHDGCGNKGRGLTLTSTRDTTVAGHYRHTIKERVSCLVTSLASPMFLPGTGVEARPEQRNKHSGLWHQIVRYTEQRNKHSGTLAPDSQIHRAEKQTFRSLAPDSQIHRAEKQTFRSLAPDSQKYRAEKQTFRYSGTR